MDLCLPWRLIHIEIENMRKFEEEEGKGGKGKHVYTRTHARTLLNKRNGEIRLSIGLGTLCMIEINLVIVNTVPGNTTRT